MATYVKNIGKEDVDETMSSMPKKQGNVVVRWADS